VFDPIGYRKTVESVKHMVGQGEHEVPRDTTEQRVGEGGPPERLLTIAEAAEKAERTGGTIQRWIKKGWLRAIPGPDGKRRVSEDDLKAAIDYVQARRQGSKSKSRWAGWWKLAATGALGALIAMIVAAVNGIIGNSAYALVRPEFRYIPSIPIVRAVERLDPPRGDVFETFSDAVGRWRVIVGNGSELVPIAGEEPTPAAFAREGDNWCLRLTPPAGGAVEAFRNTGGPLLKGYTAIRLKIDLHGAHLGDGTASAFYLDPPGDDTPWRIASLSRYVTQGKVGWQQITIPLDHFVADNGQLFYNQRDVVRIGFRIWMPSAGTKIDIDDIVFVR
jgi:hypothetical protein